MLTLRECLPTEFTGGEYHNTRAFKLKDREVMRCVDGCVPGNGWPGREVNVMNWYILDDGYTYVGFNENPSRGWSFPVYIDQEAKRISRR